MTDFIVPFVKRRWKIENNCNWPFDKYLHLLWLEIIEIWDFNGAKLYVLENFGLDAILLDKIGGGHECAW